MRPPALFCLHDDTEWLLPALRSFSSVERIACISRESWNGVPGAWQEAVSICEAEGVEVILGDWTSEDEHRQAGLNELKSRGFQHVLIPDGDEVIEPKLLDNLVRFAEADLADRIYIEWDTYWKTPDRVIRPREPFTPCIMTHLERSEHKTIREYIGGRGLLLNSSYGIIHHLSYAGSDERILRKTTTWSHRTEVQENWYERVWQGWDNDPTLCDLHPTHPTAYQIVERIPLPEVFSQNGVKSQPGPVLAVPAKLPTVSIVIPLHGQPDDISLCLQSLEACQSLLHEVIVVDNASPDNAADVAEEILDRMPCGTVIRLPQNTGFAHASNRGYEASTGEVVLFLNSDTVVTSAGLIRLMETLMSSGSVAAAGPMSNNVGHFQRVNAPYTSLAHLNLFTEDFAASGRTDSDTDMLVGFCMAVKRHALQETGGFDESFGIGTFEDNDLCYRLRRAGWRLRLSARSFVHHSGSQTLTKVVSDVEGLINSNKSAYLFKWRDDLETGYVNTLSGLSAEPIQFHPQRKPEDLKTELIKLAKQADISLCMIVKNEERVLADCLSSVRPFVTEAIIVDTGSTDKTMEIAKSFKVKLIEEAWQDSFSHARNTSIKDARGKWILWVDADDTLPLASAEQIIHACINAPKEVAAFVIPVRFLDEGEGGGVQVDHVKLIRNQKGLNFEGRFHEQILPSIRELGGQVSRLERAYVLHSGYDTSEEGQARKRERDKTLLMLDYQERPNHPFVLFNLGMTCHYSAEHEEAVDWLEKSIAAAHPSESHVRKAYAMLGVSLQSLGREGEAVQKWQQGLIGAPGDPELMFHIANAASRRGDHKEAVQLFEKILQTDISGHFSSIDRGILGYKSMHNLAVAELAIGNKDRAEYWFAKAREANPRGQ